MFASLADGAIATIMTHFRYSPAKMPQKFRQAIVYNDYF
jgi:hypothetical protein